MSRKSVLEARYKALRASERTYSEHVTSNKKVLGQIRQQIQATLADLAALKPQPMTQDQMRRKSANILVREIRADAIRHPETIRNVRVEHSSRGPLGGMSSSVQYQARDSSGKWHEIRVQVYVLNENGMIDSHFTHDYDIY